MASSTKKKNKLMQFATRKIALELGKAAIKTAAVVAAKIIVKKAIEKAMTKPKPIKGINKESRELERNDLNG